MFDKISSGIDMLDNTLRKYSGEFGFMKNDKRHHLLAHVNDSSLGRRARVCLICVHVLRLA